MNEIIHNFDKLISDATSYLIDQQLLYGSDIYFHQNIDNKSVASPGKKRQQLQQFYESVNGCQKCILSQTRHTLVFGGGNPDSVIMLIGEAPGYDEDMQGNPFVGAAGQLLTKMLQAIHLDREDVYITNIIKCRPPKNRDPLPDEIENCMPCLIRQIEIIEPKFILALGRIAAQVILKTTKPMNELRGTVYDFRKAKVLATYHPAALLRNPQWKKNAWSDLQKLQQLLSTQSRD